MSTRSHMRKHWRLSSGLWRYCVPAWRYPQDKIRAARRAVCNASEDDMKSFGLIFVLYQPTEEFLDNLTKARAVCPKVVAVDNSPEADVRLHECLREQGMQVIFNRNAGGLAGAYNKGAEVLLVQQ